MRVKTHPKHVNARDSPNGRLPARQAATQAIEPTKRVTEAAVSSTPKG